MIKMKNAVEVPFLRISFIFLKLGVSTKRINSTRYFGHAAQTPTTNTPTVRRIKLDVKGPKFLFIYLIGLHVDVWVCVCHLRSALQIIGLIINIFSNRKHSKRKEMRQTHSWPTHSACLFMWFRTKVMLFLRSFIHSPLFYSYKRKERSKDRLQHFTPETNKKKHNNPTDRHRFD